MIKIVHEELVNYGNTMDSDKERLATEIDNIRKINERLKTIWKGVDANAFCHNLDNYANKMENITASMSNVSDFTRMANKKFKEVDENYASKLRAERAKYKTS